MACDIRIGLPSSKFMHPECVLGTVAPLGATKRLPRLIGLGRAKYMLFTGEVIPAEKAQEWGLIDFLVQDDEIEDFLDIIKKKLEKNPKLALTLTK